MTGANVTGYHADTGAPDYDRANFLLPPPLLRNATRTASGVCFVEQVGHSSALTDQTQEVRSTLIDHDVLLLFPEGWRERGA